MHGSSFSPLPSKHPFRPIHEDSSIQNQGLFGWHPAIIAILAALLFILLFFAVSPALSAPVAKAHRMQAAAATTTTLNVSSATVNQHAVTVLSATVTDPNAVTQGLVSFYDGKTLLGAGQIVNAGTKYTHGMANFKVQLAPGTHALKAVFAGTTSDAASVSSVHNLTITGGASATTLTFTGKQGNYTLTGQVVTKGPFAASGPVAFVDSTSIPNVMLGGANLGAGTVTAKYSNPAAYAIYDPTDNNRPMQVIVADFNGDGILDFAEVDYTAAISIHLGNGDGTFQPATPFCTTGNPPTPCQAGSEPTSIVVADFNSDGIPDLAVNDGSNVDVFLGNGDGTFEPGVAYATASGNYTIAVGDFNRDGTPDFAVAAEDAVSILLGNGDGTFQPNTDISLSDSSWYVTVGDFNKDGIQDLAIAGGNGTNFMVLLGNGDGTFKSEIDTAYADMNPGANIVAADFKGQGYLCDLALSGSGIAEALLGKGDGTFQTPVELEPNGSVWEYTGSVAIADFNGDGIPDLVMTWYENTDTAVGRVAVFYGKGDGTFSAPTTVNVGTTSATGVQPVWVATGDFDGNGSPDLVTANAVSSTDSVILNASTTIVSAVLSNIAVPGTGTHNVFAQYGGNTAFAGSQSAAVQLTAGGTVVAPTLSSLTPNTAVAGGAAFTLVVKGTNFASGAAVKWNGYARTTAFVSATQLSAAILASDIATAGACTVTVTVGSTASSNSLTFTVTPPVVVPAITSISPNDMPAESAAFTLSVNGTGFVNGSAGTIIYWNSAKLTTTFVSSTKLTASIPAADVATAGSASVTVKTGSGPASNALTFTITPEAYAPIAMGFFAKDGTPGATSGNITCAWQASSLDYWCTLAKSGFYFKNYVVNVTSADAGNPAVATVNSIEGSPTNPMQGFILVKFYNLSGTAVQEPFYICVYKP